MTISTVDDSQRTAARVAGRADLVRDCSVCPMWYLRLLVVAGNGGETA